MIADLHVHTEISCDSEAEMEQYVIHGIRSGVNMISFTDHVDWNRVDYGYGVYDPEKYFKKFHYVKECYEHEIKICSGIEFGETHLYPEELRKLVLKYPYDFVIGSVHWVEDMFPGPIVKAKYSVKDFFDLYWKVMLDMVKFGGFDSLGHIDFPKRYFGELYYSEKKINEIFKYLLDKDMVLEINTSSIRKGCTETMPGRELLELYKANGGRYVTVGSDAHVVKDLGADNQIAKDLIKELELQEVVYINRQRMNVKSFHL